jgi:hypothetical protein
VICTLEGLQQAELAGWLPQVGRASGTVCRYSLPHLALEATHTLRCGPQRLALNCSGSRMAVLDGSNVLSMFDFGPGGAAGTGAGLGQHVEGWERRDVWDVRWAQDDPELLVCCEKSKMVAIRWAQLLGAGWLARGAQSARGLLGCWAVRLLAGRQLHTANSPTHRMELTAVASCPALVPAGRWSPRSLCRRRATCWRWPTWRCAARSWTRWWRRQTRWGLSSSAATRHGGSGGRAAGCRASAGRLPCLACCTQPAAREARLAPCREARTLVETSGAAEAAAFISSHSHPRLWRILAQHCLRQMDLATAEKAFVHCQDYPVSRPALPASLDIDDTPRQCRPRCAECGAAACSC